MPKDGILDPQGRAVETSLPHLGVSDGPRRPRRADGWSSAWTPRMSPAARALVERLARELFANPLIEAVADRGRGRAAVKVGVVVFPGSNCDRDALHAARLAGADAEPLWHEDADLHGADLVVLPGGFAYGDYLRAGVLARFSPIMGAVRDHAARGGLVLGICNGFQVLAEAGLVPGGTAAQRQPALRASLGAPLRGADGHALHLGRARTAGRCGCRSPTGRAATSCPTTTLTRSRRAGGVVFRYAPPEGNPNGSVRDIAGVIDEAGTVCGLMPHPERAAEAILGSDDGLLLLRSVVESAAAARPAATTALHPAPAAALVGHAG